MTGSVGSGRRKFGKWVNHDDPSAQADLKSIMNVFTLSIPKGGHFDIDIEGVDEEEAYKSFNQLLESLPL